MSRTYGDVITRARSILQDTVTPYRYPDADLYAALDNAVLEARRIRPDLFLGSMTTAPVAVTSALAAAAFPLPAQFIPPFVAYVSGWGELRDDEYAQDGRAVALMTRFSQQLLGVG